MSFLDSASDAFDALSSNVLPFFQASQETAQAKQNANVQIAQANATATQKASDAKLYASLAVAGVAAVALLIIIKKSRR